MSRVITIPFHFLLQMIEVKKAVMSIPTDSKAVEDSKDPDKIKFLLYTNYS